MFADDIALVFEAAHKYGLKLPLVDLGGQEHPVVADYALDRIGRFGWAPFARLDERYEILNPEKGDPPIEELPQRDFFGTAVCLSVLEHARDPFAVFRGIHRVLQPGGLAIVSTVFEYRYHGAPDYWRFSPDGLRYLAAQSGFDILECDWRVDVPNAIMIDGTRGPVKSVYIIMRKGSNEHAD